MKVLVVNNMAPFVWGGAEELAANLQKHLTLAGHRAQLLRIPFQWEPAARIPSQMLLTRALEVHNVDRVIALKFPAYLIQHHHKTLWLVHQYRQAYDLYDANMSNLIGPHADDLRALIQRADEEAFREVQRIFTISEVVRQRLAHYNGFDAQVLLTPLADPERFRGGPSQGYIFAGGRINGMKRQHLLVEAMAYAPRATRLVIAGPPESDDDALRLHRLVEQLGLENRVTLDLRFLSREEIASYVNGAAACAYIPYDEDALGYVTIEAASAGKAVITATDSGGVLGLVKHGVTGWAAAPEPRAIAEALAQATASPQRARERGKAAQELLQRLDITWPKTVERLLA